MSPTELQAAVARSHRALRFDALKMYSGCISGMIGFGIIAAVFADSFIRTGAILIAMNFVYVLFLTARDRPTRESANAIRGFTDPSVAFYRADLERHVVLLSGSRLWSRFVVAIPAVCLLFVGLIRTNPSAALPIYLSMVACAIGLTSGVLLARRRTRTYQQRIDELDAILGVLRTVSVPLSTRT